MPDTDGRVIKIRVIDKPDLIEDTADAICKGLEEAGLEIIEQSRPSPEREDSPEAGKARLYLVAIR
jgi:hypothetical protein